ncbi:hypothetical protein LUX57_15810 [Actinomadura madurae]|nr:hypothetical protein [Actinomadura madurae]MCP9966383.1 hypothetical protein [Actinomadura madurae]
MTRTPAAIAVAANATAGRSSAADRSPAAMPNGRSASASGASMARGRPGRAASAASAKAAPATKTGV